MKKGEIQITVVATGFDEERMPILEENFEKASRLTIEEKIKPEVSSDDSQNSFSPKTEPKMIIEEKIPPKIRRINITRQEKEMPDEDDELEIPAFIRRKMGK